MFLKFLCVFEHSPESNRPVRFVTLLKVFGLTLQMSYAKLMVAYRGLKVSLPAIVNKYCFFGDSAHIFIDRSCASVVRSNNISSSIILSCPEPMFFSVDFHTRFVCTNNSAVQYILPYHFVGINTFRCQPVQQAMQTTFTNLNIYVSVFKICLSHEN